MLMLYSIVRYMNGRYRFFFFNDTATTEIYTLSLHDALPIWLHVHAPGRDARGAGRPRGGGGRPRRDRAVAQSSTRRSEEPRLNSSHANISYAVFCLKKKKKHNQAYFIHPYPSYKSHNTHLSY